MANQVRVLQTRANYRAKSAGIGRIFDQYIVTLNLEVSNLSMHTINLIPAQPPNSQRILVSVRFWLVTVIGGLLLISSGCAPRPAHSIESVLNKCALLSKKVNASSMNAGQAASYLAAEMQKVDTRDCPEDFRVAFQQHINAWREAAPYLSQNTTLNAVMEGIAGGLLEDPSLIGASQRNAAVVLRNINETYSNLVNLAASHGARIPTSVINK